MRPAPAFQIGLRHFGLWRAGVGALALAAGASITAWTFTGSEPAGPAAWPLLALTWAGLAALAVSLCKIPALSLRWDGQCWHLGPAGSVGHEPWSGELQLCIDLGAFMLLRWRAAPGLRAPLAWLPVQRRGHEAHWHALRCTVHSPRPAPHAAAS